MVRGMEISVKHLPSIGSHGGLRYNMLISCIGRKDVLVSCEEQRLDLVEAAKLKIECLLVGQEEKFHSRPADFEG
jgi:hypothetical protein